MISNEYDNWQIANQNYLVASLAIIKNILTRYAGLESLIVDQQQLEQTLEDIRAILSFVPALDQVVEIFNLSSFERDILLLCAGIELDNKFSQICAQIHNDLQCPYPTFSIALTVFENAHWNALMPSAPLRFYRLIRTDPNLTLTSSPLQIDEKILHYLMGNNCLDIQLQSLLKPMVTSNQLVDSHVNLANYIVTILSKNLNVTSLPLIQLYGQERNSQEQIVTSVCNSLGLQLYKLSSFVFSSPLSEIEVFKQLWTREAALNAAALLINGDDLVLERSHNLMSLSWLIERTSGLIFITSRNRLYLSQCPVISFQVDKPNYLEQQAIWQSSLQQQIPHLNQEINGQFKHHLQQLASSFNLNRTQVQAACNKVLSKSNVKIQEDLIAELWEACRSLTQPQLDDLAYSIQPKAKWQDLILPEEQIRVLHEISAHVRQRFQVYENWGFRAKESRGLGITALFAGPSGTGKTLAAEVLAYELKLDLYRIELSSVISKYIGETEKNLQKIFDNAEESSVILLFDEADALFGKRSEVKDSRDRYANIEVSYLLQRMENYPGLAILTTNLKSGIDNAFLRRIRFIIQFPFPDVAQRAAIWNRVFPDATPLQGIDIHKLAQLNIAGGNIRNIALNAAFLAADAEEMVQMKHILQATQTEYNKLEKTLTEAEVFNW